MFSLVPCPSLSDSSNGMINCSLGDDGVPSYEDTCSFTCNTGYELTGSDTRTCQSDGSWSGNNTMCNRGEYVSCVCVMCSLIGVHICSHNYAHYTISLIYLSSLIMWSACDCHSIASSSLFSISSSSSSISLLRYRYSNIIITSTLFAKRMYNANYQPVSWCSIILKTLKVHDS